MSDRHDDRPQPPEDQATYQELIWGLKNDLVQHSVAPFDAAGAQRLAARVAELAASVAGLSADAAHLLDQAGRDIAAALAADAWITQALGALDELEARLPPPPHPTDTEPAPPAILDNYDTLDASDLKDFCAEAREGVQSIEAGLLELEGSGAGEALDAVFRAAHSIKGGAQYIGLDATSALAHRVETLLERIRSHKILPGAHVTSLLLRASDGLRALVEGAARQTWPGVDVASLLLDLDAASRPEAAEAAPPAPEQTPRPALPPTPPASGFDASRDLEMFALEYKEHMASARAVLADRERLGADPERAATLRRDLHSIKGIAGFVGLTAMERLAYTIELTLLRALGTGAGVPARLSASIEDALVTLDQVFRGFREGQSHPFDIDATIRRLETSEASEGLPEPLAPASSAAAAGAVSTGASDAPQPLAHLFCALLDAVEHNDGPGSAALLAEIRGVATLYGEDDLAAEAEHLEHALAGLDSTARGDALARLGRLLPAGTDALAGATSPAAAPGAAVEWSLASVLQAAGAGDDLLTALAAHGITDASSAAAAGLTGLLAAPGMTVTLAKHVLSALPQPDSTPPAPERERPTLPAEFEHALGADEDRELVAIWVDNTRERLDEACRRLSEGRTVEAAELVDDMCGAAAYMGYAPFEQWLRAALAAIEAPDAGPSAAQRLDAARAMLARVHARFSGAAPEPPAVPPSAPAVQAPPRATVATVATVAAPARPPAPVPQPAAAAAEPKPAPAPGPAAAARAAEPRPVVDAETDTGRGLVDAQTTVRVDTGKIDDLMNMAAELVVNRSSLMVLASTFRSFATSLLDSGRISKNEMRELRNLVNRYDEVTTDLGRVGNQLQEGVMKIRMLPLHTLFARVPRVVRDLGLREGKQVRVLFAGEDTELDKTVIEQLSDPLLHLIRNAIGHGIETPAERRAAGKPEEGTLQVAAHHQGNMVILEVTDDGRGVDLEAVRQRLVSTGTLAQADAARLAPRELHAALFAPGFSTAARVNEISGRGVGLDVVKGNIERIGGSVEITSEPGRFCRFSIRIPLTMAIMQALLVQVASEVFSLPVAAVIQAVKVRAADLGRVENQEVITVRGKVIPLVRLDEVFSFPYYEATQQARMDPRTADGEIHVVVIQGDGRELGLVVDSLLGGQDIVIKSLDDELVDARGVAGAAILGDGTVTLILDVADLQKMTVDPKRYEHRGFDREIERFARYLREAQEHATPIA